MKPNGYKMFRRSCGCINMRFFKLSTLDIPGYG
jgi:hypothetical protein